MGKGGTKFNDVSVHSRIKKRKWLKNSELQKAMEVYQKTGKHPIYAALVHGASERYIHALPPHDLTQPYAYLKISIDGEFAGQLVFELFQSQVSHAVDYFKQRCCKNSLETLKGSLIEKIHSGYALYCKFQSRKLSDSLRIMRNTSLHHTGKGEISLSHDGSHFVITLTRAIQLDANYQVIGRLCYGDACLAKIGYVDVDNKCKPVQAIEIRECGNCSHSDLNDVLLDSDSDIEEPRKQY